MKYDKNAILNTASNLRSKASGLGETKNKISHISPIKCSPSFYSKRSALVQRLGNVQNEINNLSNDISNAANKMTSDDVQNARVIRQAFQNRTSSVSFGQTMLTPFDRDLGRSGVYGNTLLFSQVTMRNYSPLSLGKATSGNTPWYKKAWGSIENGFSWLGKKAVNFGEKVGEFGKAAWQDTKQFFSDAGDWLGDRVDDYLEWEKAKDEYIRKSVLVFILGDYSGENQTALSFGGNLVASFFDVDLPLDIRDFVYDIQHWGEGDNFGLYFALDVVALLPVVGMLKNVKYADDIADGVKDLGKIADAVSDAGKTADNIGDALDDAKDLGKVVEGAADAGKTVDNISDAVDDAKDLGKAADDAGDIGKLSKEIPERSLSDMPEGIRDSYEKYERANWKGNFENASPGTHAGGVYNNADNTLPQFGKNGEAITYKEYDVYNKSPEAPFRDDYRFVRGSDGSVYYTEDHYETFIRIK